LTGEPLFGIDERKADNEYATYVNCPERVGKEPLAKVEEVKKLPC
jgi:hypothetical protein